MTLIGFPTVTIVFIVAMLVRSRSEAPAYIDVYAYKAWMATGAYLAADAFWPGLADSTTTVVSAVAGAV